jgi:hypothetical protein
MHLRRPLLALTLMLIGVGLAALPGVAGASANCSLAHGAEGGFALPYRVSGVSCHNAKPVVKSAIGCRHIAGRGCAIRGYRCRDVHPSAAGYAAPGDVITCTAPRRRIRFDEPG